MAMCLAAIGLAAVAQTRPPKGYNSAKGDFNGDGKQEYVYYVPPAGADDWENADLDQLNGRLRCTGKNIPSFTLKQSVQGIPMNLGDLDGDGRDEIGIQPQWVTSNWQIYRVLTFKRGKWQDAIEPFTVYIGDNDFEANPPVKKLGKGQLQVTTYGWDDGYENIIEIPKVVKMRR